MRTVPQPGCPVGQNYRILSHCLVARWPGSRHGGGCMFRLFHLTLIAATVVLGIIGVSRISYNVEVLDLLPRDLAGVEGTRILKDIYERADQLVMTLETGDTELAGEAVESLSAAMLQRTDLFKQVQTKPIWESDPQVIASLAAYSWLNAPPDQVAALEAGLAPEKLKPMLESRLQDLATAVDEEAIGLGAYDPLGLLAQVKRGLDPNMMRSGGGSEYSSADGTFRVIYADPSSKPGSYQETDAWLKKVRTEVVDTWQQKEPKFAGIKVGFTGAPAFRAEIATGMEADMSQSVGGITFIVGFLFWLLHRTMKPLLLLMLSLFSAGLLTLGVAGLLYGSLNVMSMGFAAILMGMIEDFGVVGLHEWLEHPQATFREIHRRVFPGIFWSALTSSMVFGSLAFSVLPGIAQLGILTGIGILVGAAVMLYGFLPLAMKWSARSHDRASAHPVRYTFPRLPGIAAIVILAACVVVLAVRGLPIVYSGPNVLHPENCQAMAVVERLYVKLQPPEREGEWQALLLHKATEAELISSLDHAAASLDRAKADGHISTYYLPRNLAPDPQRQEANRAALPRLAAAQESVLKLADETGYSEEGVALAKGVFEFWKKWAAEGGTGIRWPDPALLQASLGKLLHLKPGSVSASGFVRLPQGQEPSQSPLVEELTRQPGVFPGGWKFLGEKLKPLVRQEIMRVCLPAAGVLSLLLIFVFRNVREILLALTSLAFSGLILVAAMSALGIQWNFVNLGAVPLSLGLGLDFNIHMIYALRRLRTEPAADVRGVGRALAYCGLSTGLGFGSLAMSGNRGLITFGQCSMIGVLATLFTAAFLVPWLWRRIFQHAGQKA